MIQNYFKIAFRTLLKHKLFSVINFAGLSVAMTIGLLAYIFIEDEFSYDKHHINSDRLFLLYEIDYKADVMNVESGFFDTEPNPDVQKGTSFSLPFLTLVEERVPEIKQVLPVEYNFRQIDNDGVKMSESVHYVSPEFFQAFTFNFIKGSSESSLEELNSVIITKEVALKYFGKIDVVGEVLNLVGESDEPFLVSGVIEPTENSVLKPNIFLRLEQSYYVKENSDNWNYLAINCFLLLNNKEDEPRVAEKINKLYIERFGEKLATQREKLKLSDSNPVIEQRLKSIKELYLDPSIRYGKSSSPLYSLIIASIALIIILIACINYLSISISGSSGRQLEISVRKVMGANRSQIRGQLYTESMLITLASVFGGFTLMQVILPKFNELSGKSIELTAVENIEILGVSLIFGICIALFAGGYPSLIQARFKTLSGLKGNTTSRVNPGFIKGIVVFQFTLCLFFISMSLIMSQQFRFMNNKDLGFDKDQLVYVNNVWGKTDLIKQLLLKEPSIESVTGAGGIFGTGRSLGRVVLNDQEYTITRVRVDRDFFETLKIPFLMGEGFSPDMSDESLMNGQVMNESQYNLWKSDSAKFSDVEPNLLGVVKDFHFESLTKAINPITFNLSDLSSLSSIYVRLRKTEEGIAGFKRDQKSSKSGVALRKLLTVFQNVVAFGFDLVQ